MPAGKNPLYRILDANFNRSKEGLRVCEDVCRYVWNNKVLSCAFKDLRHALTAAVENLGILKALSSRNVEGDVGRLTGERARKDLAAVFRANAQRVKESLRVLEEIAKLIDLKTAMRVKNLRYKMYALEQKALKRS